MQATLIPALVVAFLVLLPSFSAYVAYRMVKPKREIGRWNPRGLGFDFEDVTIETDDGLRLGGWWIPRGGGKTVLLLHGYTSSRWNETYIRPAMEFLLEEGYSVLTLDLRAHGTSDGKYTTVGDREIMDVKAAVEWLKRNHEREAGAVGIIGFSMGAVLAIRALAEMEELSCGVADSPPIYMDKTGARGLKYFAGLPEWFYSIVKPFTLAISGGKPVNTIIYTERVRKPLLLIAGERDPLVKVDEVREFYERNRKVNPDVELWVTDAPHVRTLKLHPEEWKDRVGKFLMVHLT